MKTYLYLFVMALTTYLIRVLPLTLIRKPIRNRFLRSFLYYVPYVTLAVMTFPAIMIGHAVAPSRARRRCSSAFSPPGAGLRSFPVSLLCCATVFILEFFLV